MCGIIFSSGYARRMLAGLKHELVRLWWLESQGLDWDLYICVSPACLYIQSRILTMCAHYPPLHLSVIPVPENSPVERDLGWKINFDSILRLCFYEPWLEMDGTQYFYNCCFRTVVVIYFVVICVLTCGPVRPVEDCTEALSNHQYGGICIQFSLLQKQIKTVTSW